MKTSFVVPAKVGDAWSSRWIPAFAGMTNPGVIFRRVSARVMECGSEAAALECERTAATGAAAPQAAFGTRILRTAGYWEALVLACISKRTYSFDVGRAGLQPRRRAQASRRGFSP